MNLTGRFSIVAMRRNGFREIRQQALKGLPKVIRHCVTKICLEPSRPRQQLSQHIWQDAAVQVVIDLDWCVDA